MSSQLNRFERVASRITADHGVHVEWAPANREYVVEGRPCGTARAAEGMAKALCENYSGIGRNYVRGRE